MKFNGAAGVLWCEAEEELRAHPQALCFARAMGGEHLAELLAARVSGMVFALRETAYDLCGGRIPATEEDMHTEWEAA